VDGGGSPGRGKRVTEHLKVKLEEVETTGPTIEKAPKLKKT